MKQSVHEARALVDFLTILYFIQVIIVFYISARGTLTEALIAGVGCGYIRWEWKKATRALAAAIAKR